MGASSQVRFAFAALMAGLMTAMGDNMKSASLTFPATFEVDLLFPHNETYAAIYNGMYFGPEREFVQHAIEFSQRQVDGKVKPVAYKGCAYVVGRSSETSNLYSADESSMDTLDMNWTPQDTSGFIAIQSIRIEKYGARKIKDGEPLARV